MYRQSLFSAQETLYSWFLFESCFTVSSSGGQGVAEEYKKILHSQMVLQNYHNHESSMIKIQQQLINIGHS